MVLQERFGSCGRWEPLKGQWRDMEKSGSPTGGGDRGVWAVAIPDPWRGLGAPHRPQGSPQESDREQGSGPFSEGIQTHHAPPRHQQEKPLSVVHTHRRGPGVRGTCVTAPVTPGPLQPQDLAIVNRRGLISSLLTRPGCWGWTLAWWAASTGTWRNHPPCPPPC